MASLDLFLAGARSNLQTLMSSDVSTGTVEQPSQHIASSTTTTEPTGFTTELAGFTTEPAGFTTEPAGFTTEPTSFTTELSGFTTESTGFTTEPSGFTEDEFGTSFVAANVEF